MDFESANELNLYCYCLNNPISYYDPSGHIVWWAIAIIVVGVLAIVTTVGEKVSGSSNYEIEYYYDINKNIMGFKYLNQEYLYFKNIQKMNLSKEIIINFLYDGQLLQFDYAKNPNFNILTSIYYSKILYEIGLPNDRTFEGVWVELLVHYVIYKVDVFDTTDRDDIADIGSYEYDENAQIWENFVCIVKGVLRNARFI